MKFKCAFPKVKARTLPQVIVLQILVFKFNQCGGNLL